MSTKQKDVVIKVEDLAISFSTDAGRLHAVRGVNFELYKGEVLAIVGESGSGKSVSAKTIMGILPANGRVDDGRVIYEGEDLTKVSEEEFHRIRGKKIGMIFQDPLSSLNPIMKVGRQITEAIIIHGNKLKNMYDDIIVPQNIAYRNEITMRDKRIEDEQYTVYYRKQEIRKLKREIKSNGELSKEQKAKEIADLNAGFVALKKEKAMAIKTIKIEAKPLIAKFKDELKVAKIAAKKEVLAYKANLVSTYKAKHAALKDAHASASDPETKAKLNAEILALKEEHVSTLRITPRKAKEMAIKVMEEVGIPQAERRFKQYPFEFSGGMRQRIVIAIALIQNPDILICDEPTTALDVTIQAQILELILRLKRERELSVIFITHDLGVVANMADRVAVMYAGQIVEYGLVEEIYYDPRHPYTWALLSSIPDVDSEERLEAIPGTPPNMVYPPVGDAFAARSKYAMAVDFIEAPPYFQVSETHYARTWLLDERAPKVEMPRIVSERIRISSKGRQKT